MELASLLIAVLVVATVAAGIAYWRRPSRPRGLSEIDRMDGPAFERYLVQLFTRLGFSVQHVGARNDYGADLVVERNGSRIAVQAKARKDYVAISAVQQALGARFYYRCDGALVVTNRYFSTPAKRLAAKAEVALWDRDELALAISTAESRAAGAGAASVLGR